MIQSPAAALGGTIRGLTDEIGLETAFDPSAVRDLSRYADSYIPCLEFIQPLVAESNLGVAPDLFDKVLEEIRSIATNAPSDTPSSSRDWLYERRRRLEELRCSLFDHLLPEETANLEEIVSTYEHAHQEERESILATLTQHLVCSTDKCRKNLLDPRDGLLLGCRNSRFGRGIGECLHFLGAEGTTSLFRDCVGTYHELAYMKCDTETQETPIFRRNIAGRIQRMERFYQSAIKRDVLSRENAAEVALEVSESLASAIRFWQDVKNQ